MMRKRSFETSSLSIRATRSRLSISVTSRVAIRARRPGAGAAVRLVPRERARPPLAEDARPVRDPRLRGDAAADAGRARRPALDGLARALADGRRARDGSARR